MKKSIIFKTFATIGFISIIAFSNTHINKEGKKLLDCDNIEALARGEVEIPGVCANVNMRLCILFDDGYFLTGLRVA